MVVGPETNDVTNDQDERRCQDHERQKYVDLRRSNQGTHSGLGIELDLDSSLKDIRGGFARAVKISFCSRLGFTSVVKFGYTEE
jgi:hypothetical protein